MLGSEGWHQHLTECRLQTPSHAGAGGKYNGQDLKNILKPKNLEKLAQKLPDGRTITAYMAALDLLHTMCVAKSVIPYNVWGICQRFRTTFEDVYMLRLGLSATPKVHICWSHIPEWYMLEETGLHTLYMADCSNGESAHGAMKRLEQRCNLEVRRDRGSERECRALETTVANFNWANDVILTSPVEEAAQEVTLEAEAVEVIQSFNHDVGLIQYI